MGKKWFVMTVLFFSVLAVTFLGFRAFALKSECPVCQMRKGKMSCCSTDGYLCQKLGMSQEQSKVMTDIDKSFDMKRDNSYKLMKQDKARIAELLKQANPDKEALKTAVASLSKHREQLEQAALSHLLTVKNILNEKQKEQFEGMLDQKLLE